MPTTSTCRYETSRSGLQTRETSLYTVTSGRSGPGNPRNASRNRYVQALGEAPPGLAGAGQTGAVRQAGASEQQARTPEGSQSSPHQRRAPGQAQGKKTSEVRHLAPPSCLPPGVDGTGFEQRSEIQRGCGETRRCVPARGSCGGTGCVGLSCLSPWYCSSLLLPWWSPGHVIGAGGGVVPPVSPDGGWRWLRGLEKSSPLTPGGQLGGRDLGDGLPSRVPGAGRCPGTWDLTQRTPGPLTSRVVRWAGSPSHAGETTSARSRPQVTHLSVSRSTSCALGRLTSGASPTPVSRVRRVARSDPGRVGAVEGEIGGSEGR